MIDWLMDDSNPLIRLNFGPGRLAIKREMHMCTILSVFDLSNDIGRVVQRLSRMIWMRFELQKMIHEPEVSSDFGRDMFATASVFHSTADKFQGRNRFDWKTVEKMLRTMKMSDNCQFEDPECDQNKLDK